MDFLTELLIEVFLELFVGGGVEAAGNKRLPKWVRYAAVLLTALLYLAVFVLLTWIGLDTMEKEPIGGMFILLFTGLLLAVSVGMLRKKYRAQKKGGEDEGISH